MLASVMFWEVVERSGIPQKITDFLIQITLLDEGEAPFSNTEQFIRLSAILAVAWAVLSSGAHHPRGHHVQPGGRRGRGSGGGAAGGERGSGAGSPPLPPRRVRVEPFSSTEQPGPAGPDQPTMLVESE